MIKVCKYMFLHLSIFHFCHFVIVTIRTHFWPFSSEETLWKILYGIIKKSRKTKDQKNRNGQILRIFGPYIFWPNYSKVCKFCTYTTSHSFFEYSLPIFQIEIVQWLNCRNLKYELNRSYNGGEVVYCKVDWDASLFSR